MSTRGTPESPRDAPSSDEALPEGWILCKSKSNPGKKYYFDRKTGSSLWTKPPMDPGNCSKNTSRKCKKNKKNLGLKKSSEPEKASKQTSKRKSDDSDTLNVAHKRTKREEELTHSSSPSCSSTGTTGTPKTYSYETHRKGSEFLSPSIDSFCRDSHIISPNCRQNYIAQVKEQKHIPKNTLKSKQSPTSNELGCFDDNYNDMKYSPSQFFEASKLICSLQNHLADEKGVKAERKDTFARIEEGITKESVEYSSKDHPATPPHFRKASEIVCTIKSRLNENISVSEKKPRHSTPANDRLAALRSSLNQSASDCNKYGQMKREYKPVLFESKTNVMPQKPSEEHIQDTAPHRPVAYCTQKSEDNMEIDPIIQMRTKPSRTSSDTHPVDNLVLVVDTNIFIHDIQFLKSVLDSYITGYKDKPTLMVPWQVINELDRMKDNKNEIKQISLRAKNATDYLYQVLPNSDRVKGQTLRDASNHIYPCELPDDEILNCCLQQSQRGNAVILLSNDKNLCTRATINSISAMGVREMKDLLRSQTDHYGEGDLRELLKYYEGCIYQLLANILENEMRARYNNIWQHVLFKAPPWSLLDVLQCLVKHWIAVFSEVFPRIEPLIQQLKLALTKIHDKGPRVTLPDIKNFKELAHELASKCQIIPEYMELAKLTVERLQRDQSDRNLTLKTAPEDEERLVVNTFENLWTAFSSYCAKLATLLGVNHQLETRSENSDSPEIIKSKWTEYNNHIQSLAYALKRTLTANENSGIEPLHTTLSECLTLIGSNSHSIDNDTLRNFCLNNRNMIHEALVKFSQLTELLGRCQNCINN